MANIGELREFGEALVTAYAELSAAQKPGTQSSITAHERIRITTTLGQVRNIHTDDTGLSRRDLSRIVTRRRPMLTTH